MLWSDQASLFRSEDSKLRSNDISEPPGWRLSDHGCSNHRLTTINNMKLRDTGVLARYSWATLLCCFCQSVLGMYASLRTAKAFLNHGGVSGLQRNRNWQILTFKTLSDKPFRQPCTDRTRPTAVMLSKTVMQRGLFSKQQNQQNLWRQSV